MTARELTDLIDLMRRSPCTHPHTRREAIFALQIPASDEHRARIAQACRAACVTLDWGPVERMLGEVVV